MFLAHPNCMRSEYRETGHPMSTLSAKSVEGMSSLTFSLQALLMRHEAYIADSERERKSMTAHIESLEAEKVALEKKNATVIEENRNLLDQLEALNSAVSESDAHVVNLQATLQSTHHELQKLSQLASRTEWLEKQLAEFEREQASLQTSIETKDESEKSAIRRWQKAERTLASLQDQIERIELEAKEEKERHREIVDRMERRRAVEKELGSAATRLKGAAAQKDGSDDAGGPTVVSHFVKDILQDNANLQMGIVELREMLNNSNEEVESLRSQLLVHQPADSEENKKRPKSPLKRKDLRDEMTRANSQELHVHHHYHAPPTPAPPKPQLVRRPRKKRVGAFTSGHFTPPSGASTPRSSFSYGSPTPAAAILQQTAASVPQQIPRNRWSTHSNLTHQSLLASSGPSSPQSTTNRTSSIFDRVFSDAGLDSSRPTTPDTEDPGSPVFIPGHSKRGSQNSFRTHSAPLVSRTGLNPGFSRPMLDAIVSVEELPKLVEPPPAGEIIPEANEAEWEDQISPHADISSDFTSPMSDDLPDPLHDQAFYQKPLRRAASHESILSVSAMDIHTLKARPSQLLAPYRGRDLTTRAVISDTTAHAAHPTAMSRPTATGKSLLSGMAADQRQVGASATPIGKKVGGWIFGRWGATPAPTSAAATPVTAKKADKPGSISSASDKGATNAQATPKKPIQLRAPGINQSGPLLGFFPEAKSPPKAPVMKNLDQEALSSLLGDG